ncbi:hypothetical protein [Leucobacter sp. gxy201]|uniref:hypothetical protein n=1 Tax=Leucobacter sp. gxy201 TaxID=2957200 RepID=UPI003DA069DB
MGAQVRDRRLAVAALVLASLTALGWWVPFVPVATGTAALVLAVLTLARRGSRPLAISALVLGTPALLASAWWSLFLVGALLAEAGR